MRKVTALELRQSFSRVARMFEESGEPILLARGDKPVGVLISLRDFEERFVEKHAHAARDAVLREMDALARPAADPTPAREILREIRHG